MFMKSLKIFDPFQKVSLKTDFNEYKNLFQLIISDCDLKSLEEEFKHYLLEEFPEIDNFDIIKYWCSLSLSYPLLSKVAFTCLCIACGSLDAERSFSKFRSISNKHRAKLNIDSIKKYSLLYFNGDIEGVFDNY